MNVAQIAERLDTIDRRIDVLIQTMEARFAQIEQRFTQLEQKLDSRFMWLTGIVVGTWITTILAILFHR